MRGEGKEGRCGLGGRVEVSGVQAQEGTHVLVAPPAGLLLHGLGVGRRVGVGHLVQAALPAGGRGCVHPRGGRYRRRRCQWLRPRGRFRGEGSGGQGCVQEFVEDRLGRVAAIQVPPERVAGGRVLRQGALGEPRDRGVLVECLEGGRGKRV
jgi:hypothetical protein